METLEKNYAAPFLSSLTLQTLLFIFIVSLYNTIFF